MMIITSIESYVQAVMNVPALLQNKDLLENLHPRYTELLARCSVTNPNASPQPGANPLDAAIQNLVETGTPASASAPVAAPNAPGSSNSSAAENNSNAMNSNSNAVAAGAAAAAPGGGTPTNRHSIGIAGLLCAKTRTTEFNTNFEAFLVQFSAFLDVADWGQLRLVAGVVTEMAVAITDQMIRRNPILGINLLGNVAMRLQAHDKMLTCVHASVLQLCCASYNFKAALPFIIDDFEEFTTDLKSSDNTVHLLSYLYYAGLVHTALKQYPRAIYFFEACTRVPAITLSHVMLESYKKLVLVSLIHSGEVQAPHKSSLQVVSRVLKPSATAYTELAAAFAVSVDALSNCIAKNLDAYRADSNYGLVKQVRAAQVRVSIRKLTRTFLTVSLEDLGKRAVGGGAMMNLHDQQQQGAAGDRGGVGGEAEKVVLGMIEDNSVVAKINQKDGMVRFLDELHEERGVVINGHDGGGVISKRASILDIIEGKINSCIELNRRINIMNERISTNPEFISKVVVSLDNAGGSGAAGSGSAGSLGGSEMMDQGIGGSSSSSSGGVNALSSSGGGSGLISSSNRGNAAVAAAAAAAAASSSAATGAASSSSSSSTSSSSRSNNANSNVM